MVIKDKPLSSIKADVVHAFLSVSPAPGPRLAGRGATSWAALAWARQGDGELAAAQCAGLGGGLGWAGARGQGGGGRAGVRHGRRAALSEEGTPGLVEVPEAACPPLPPTAAPRLPLAALGGWAMLRPGGGWGPFVFTGTFGHVAQDTLAVCFPRTESRLAPRPPGHVLTLTVGGACPGPSGTSPSRRSATPATLAAAQFPLGPWGQLGAPPRGLEKPGELSTRQGAVALCRLWAPWPCRVAPSPHAACPPQGPGSGPPPRPPGPSPGVSSSASCHRPAFPPRRPARCSPERHPEGGHLPALF